MSLSENAKLSEDFSISKKPRKALFLALAAALSVMGCSSKQEQVEEGCTDGAFKCAALRASKEKEATAQRNTADLANGMDYEIDVTDEVEAPVIKTEKEARVAIKNFPLTPTDAPKTEIFEDLEMLRKAFLAKNTREKSIKALCATFTKVTAAEAIEIEIGEFNKENNPDQSEAENYDEEENDYKALATAFGIINFADEGKNIIDFYERTLTPKDTKACKEGILETKEKIRKLKTF